MDKSVYCYRLHLYNSCRWTAQRIRCLMSVSVDIPGHGHFDIKLTASSTAADIILLLRERLPDSPWHGNKLLSSGVCQLQCDDIVEATRHSTLVLTNYSEITNQETHLPLCSFFLAKRRKTDCVLYNKTSQVLSSLLCIAKHEFRNKPATNTNKRCAHYSTFATAECFN